MTTFDILRNYANLPIQTLEDMKDLIDDPSNDFLLGYDAHQGFDAFKWYLEKTEVLRTHTHSSMI